MEAIKEFINKYFKISTISFGWNDALEIIIFAVFIYYVILWIKRSRAWVLLKGAVTILLIYLFAKIFQLNNLLFVFHYITTYVVIGAIVILQPEIRKALEQLGSKIFISNLSLVGDGKKREEQLSAALVEEIVKAAFSLGKTKTGALIVIESKVHLDEYVSTGIALNADISNQLLIQIFEHNTPLHDGAIIIRGTKILAATCYLPLSDNMNISKELGTRHRAGLGISETSDSFTVIVSEETGSVSVAKEGVLYRSMEEESLRTMLKKQPFYETAEQGRRMIWKGRLKNEKKK